MSAQLARCYLDAQTFWLNERRSEASIAALTGQAVRFTIRLIGNFQK
jgi:hypothetical protein